MCFARFRLRLGHFPAAVTVLRTFSVALHTRFGSIPLGAICLYDIFFRRLFVWLGETRLMAPSFRRFFPSERVSQKGARSSKGPLALMRAGDQRLSTHLGIIQPCGVPFSVGFVRVLVLRNSWYLAYDSRGTASVYSVPRFKASALRFDGHQYVSHSVA